GRSGRSPPEGRESTGMIELKSPEGKVPGYLAVPKKGNGPGVLVLHAWWGLTDFFKGLSDRLANAGFIAFAPDLYRGATASTRDEAKKLLPKLHDESARRDIGGGVQDLEKLLRTLGKDVTFHTYPGTTHWFFENDRPDAYNAGAAKIAWERTVRFFTTQLPGEIRG